jgi:integrase
MTTSLYKRERSPYWWMRVARLNEDGKVLGYDRVSTKRTDKAEAKLVAQAYSKRTADVDQLGRKESMSIFEVASRYIRELEAQNKPSVKDYKVFLSRVESSVSRLSTRKMDRSFFSKIKSQGIESGYSPRYVNNMITFWVSVYMKAKRDYYLDIPEIDTRGLKMKAEAKTRYLLPGEEDKLLAELDPQRETRGIGAHHIAMRQDQYDLVVFLLDTGARYSEIATIPWSAIDVVNFKYINLYRSKVGNEGLLHISDRLREILVRRYDNQDSNYVFTGRLSDEARGYATKGIRKAITRAGLNEPHLVKRYGKFTPHSLRHTFASRLVQGGMSLYAVSKLLGHNSTAMTQRYAHLAPSQVAQEALEIINKRTD